MLFLLGDFVSSLRMSLINDLYGLILEWFITCDEYFGSHTLTSRAKETTMKLSRTVQVFSFKINSLSSENILKVFKPYFHHINQEWEMCIFLVKLQLNAVYG